MERRRIWSLSRKLTTLKPLFVRKLEEINSTRIKEYADYMQLHEQESLVVGELARLRSQEVAGLK